MSDTCLGYLHFAKKDRERIEELLERIGYGSSYAETSSTELFFPSLTWGGVDFIEDLIHEEGCPPFELEHTSGDEYLASRFIYWQDRAHAQTISEPGGAVMLYESALNDYDALAEYLLFCEVEDEFKAYCKEDT